jgi:hypothetical protein
MTTKPPINKDRWGDERDNKMPEPTTKIKGIRPPMTDEALETAREALKKTPPDRGGGSGPFPEDSPTEDRDVAPDKGSLAHGSPGTPKDTAHHLIAPALRSTHHANHAVLGWLVQSINGLDNADEVFGALLDAVELSVHKDLKSEVAKIRAFVISQGV